MAEKVDLFGFLKNVNKCDFSSVDKFSDEEIKSLSTFVLMMWAHGAQSNTMVHNILTDRLVNPFVFSLSKHPRLLLKLFIEANGGIGNTRYKFVKSVSSEKSSEIKMVANHYRVGYETAKQYHALLSKEDITELKEIYQ